jgi:glycosyltransferase involved in cell wall biosynthesis
MKPLAQVDRLIAFPLSGWAMTRTEPPAPRRSTAPSPRVAVLIPCRDEAAAIGRVVSGFRAALPDAAIYVYDNNSTDGTAAAATEAGALVRRETLQGKGHVVRRMFADIEADCYILVDGDDTYDPATAPALVDLLCGQRLDMVNAARRTTSDAAYRPGHQFGNRLLSGLVRRIFGARITDMLSGYRAFSRRYVKTFPALAQGFEIETEFTVHALDLSMPVAEIESDYRERPAGSASKLRTYRDGLRILRTIMMLVKEHRPLQFFAAAALALLLCGLALGAPVVSEFLRTGLVPRLPTAVLALGIVLLSFLSLSCGLILDSVARGRKEIKRIAYLAIAAPGAGDPIP